MHPRAAAVAVMVPVVLTGCGAAQEAASQSVARRFHAALDEQDGGAACALLAARARDEVEQSAGKPCSVAILEEDLPSPGPVEKVSTYGTAAQVRYRGETTFLSRFSDGWGVVAAGCAPVPGDRYDCQVEAG